jgi:hypothetical protein
MKKVSICMVMVFLAVSLGFSQSQDDQNQVRLAVLDYVEGVYQQQPQRIERSVHHQLSKIGFYAKNGEMVKTNLMTKQELMALAKTYNKNGIVPDNAPKEIEILSMEDHIASVKLTAYWGIDYLLLGKFDGKWLITHVMWQSHPVKKSVAADDNASGNTDSGAQHIGLLGGPQSKPGISEIHLERTACYGTCPVYKVVLRNNGSLEYEGIQNVKRIGKYRGKINLWGFNKLAQLIEKSKFMEMQDRYSIDMTDMPTVYTTVVYAGGKKKRIMNFGNAGPVELWAIEQLIDKLVEEAQWESGEENYKDQK